MTDQISAALVPHPVMVALAHALARSTKRPRPTFFVDFGEQNPFNLSCVSGWSEGIERRGVGEGTRWFTSVPRSSLPLVQVQRLRSDPVRQRSIYIRISGWFASRIGPSLKSYGIFAYHSCSLMLLQLPKTRASPLFSANSPIESSQVPGINAFPRDREQCVT